MNTKRITDKVEKALSNQMNKELEASLLYQSFGIWVEDLGYTGIASFMYRQAEEERQHSNKLMVYILDRGGKPKINSLKQPPKDPESLTDCFNAVFNFEVENTTAIHDIVNLAMEEKDWATWNFLQWFVEEQIEEETTARELIDKLKIAGGDHASDESLFTLDQSIAGMSTAEEK